MATAETSVEVLVGAMPTGNGMRKRNATPQDGEADEEQILLDPQRTSAQDGAPRTLPQRVREWWNTDPIDHRSKMVIYESTMRLMVVGPRPSPPSPHHVVGAHTGGLGDYTHHLGVGPGGRASGRNYRVCDVRLR